MTDKKTFQQKKQAQLDEWKTDIENLKTKLKASSNETREEAGEQIDALEEKLKEGRAKLAQLADSTEDAWDTMSAGLELRWDAMKAKFKETADKLKD